VETLGERGAALGLQQGRQETLGRYTLCVKLHDMALLAKSLRDKSALIEYRLSRARHSAKSPERIVSLSLPGFEHPVWLRPAGSDYYTFHQVFTEFQYEHGLTIEPSFIIDAGANIGFASVFFAKKYPDAQIFSIEPDAQNFEILLKNTAPYPNVRCLRGAVWPVESRLAITNPNQGNPAAYTVRPVEPSPSDSLSAFTPLSLLRLAKRDHIDLFKIDIEGGELELFSSGCEEWLSRTSVLLVELHDLQRPGCGQAFFQSICGRRFSYFQRGETSIVQFDRNRDDEVIAATSS
jgi:FkbM family methyltransferase